MSGENTVDSQTLGCSRPQFSQLFTEQSIVSSSESALDISRFLDISDRKFLHIHKEQSRSFDKFQRQINSPEAGYSGVCQDIISQA